MTFRDPRERSHTFDATRCSRVLTNVIIVTVIKTNPLGPLFTVGRGMKGGDFSFTIMTNFSFAVAIFLYQNYKEKALK